MKEKLNQLKEKGIPVYSFSKMGSFNNCEYEYYNSYILKNRGIPNIYTEMGSNIHDNLETIYKGEGDHKTFRASFDNKLIETELLGVNFPNESIGNSWKSDLNHFLDNFNKIDSKMILEKLIVFKIGDHWVQGYVDAILPSDKGKPYINVYDWKTSSKFAGKKLKEAGRQLLMYKIGLEQTTDFKVDKIVWFMVKYINVCHVQKNGKTKKKMCNRGKWVKEMRKSFEKDMLNDGMDDFEVEMLLDDAVERNEIDKLPQQIKDKYWTEDCIVEYEVTDEKINELEEYVNNTIGAINSKNPVEKEWKPIEIDKYNSFYCSVLCGHRKVCPFYKDFLDKNADGFDKNKAKKKDIDFDLFG